MCVVAVKAVYWGTGLVSGGQLPRQLAEIDRWKHWRQRLADELASCRASVSCRHTLRTAFELHHLPHDFPAKEEKENIAKGTTDPGVDCFDQLFWFGRFASVCLVGKVCFGMVGLVW